MRGQAPLVLLAVFGSAIGLAAMGVELGAGAAADRMLISLVVGEAYLLGGVLAWSRDRGNRTWALMAGVGVGWFLGDFAASPNALLHAAGVVFADTDAIFLIALVLAYPAGRLEYASHRVTVLVAAVGLTGSNAVALLTGDATLNLILGLGLTLVVGVLVPRRWLQAPPDRRELLTPAVLATSITLIAVGIAIVIRLANVAAPVSDVLLAIRDIGVLAIPLGFVVGSFQLAQDELRRSRTRIVEAEDTQRRRIERDLHDGAQQRLVTSALALRTLRAQLGTDVQPEVADSLDAAHDELRAGIAELRELARGIHPAALSAGGLAGGLPTLVERAAVSTELLAVPQQRLPEAIEAAAYFVASEALTNVAKHASASRATVGAWLESGRLRLEIVDNGAGGADVARGSGLTGIADRVSAVGGTLELDSPAGRGTRVTASIPVPGNSG